MIPRALTIAGSDSGGGAGIQADLKTFSAFGIYGMSAITAVTVQDTQGVYEIMAVDADIVGRQIDVVIQDIGVDVIKIGMLFSEEIIATVAQKLRRYSDVPVILDPVMRAKGGASLLNPGAENQMREQLLPLATLLTPNLPEAQALSETVINSPEDMHRAGMALVRRGISYVLVKGGHWENYPADDCLCSSQSAMWIRGERIQSVHTHGTGCTLSSAIAAEIAHGKSMTEAVQSAKNYVSRAILEAPGFGHGHGPLWHFPEGKP